MLGCWWTPTSSMSQSKMHFLQLASLCVCLGTLHILYEFTCKHHIVRNGILTPMMEAYNAEMSSVSVDVEWLFGNIINDFKFLDFKKNLKIGMSSVGKMYLVCALLHNAITCLYGNSTAEFFGLNPPSLEDYFR